MSHCITLLVVVFTGVRSCM